MAPGSLLASPFTALADRATHLADRASQLARETVASSLQEATVEYDSTTGRAVVHLSNGDQDTSEAHPHTPCSAPAEEDHVAHQMQADTELVHVRAQLAQQLETLQRLEQRRDAAEARARAALDREDQAEQRAEQAEAAATAAAAERDALKRDESVMHATSALAVATAVEAEATRWRAELESAQARLAESERARKLLEEEVLQRAASAAILHDRQAAAQEDGTCAGAMPHEPHLDATSGACLRCVLAELSLQDACLATAQTEVARVLLERTEMRAQVGAARRVY